MLINTYIKEKDNNNNKKKSGKINVIFWFKVYLFI